MTLLQHQVLALALTAVTTFGLGLLVFLAEPKRRLNQIFGVYSLTIAWWGCFEVLTLSASAQDIANFFSLTSWLGVIFIAPTFFHTTLLLTEQRNRKTSTSIICAYTVSAAFLMLLLCGQIAKPVRPVAHINYFTGITTVGTLIPVTFAILINMGLWKLGKAYFSATGQRRTQLKYLFWASVIGYIGGSPEWLLAFGWYVPVLNPFGIYTVPVHSIALSYAVLQHQLFNVVLRRSLIYSILVMTLTIGYFGLIHALERFFQLTLGYHSAWFSLGAFALVALAFQPLKTGIQTVVDGLFFHIPQEELAKRIERYEVEAQQGEKLKAVATLAAGMAHEIKNPLSSIKTFTEHLPERYDDAEFREKFVRIVGQEVDKISQLVQRLLEFAKPAPPRKQPLHLSKVIDETLEFLDERLLRQHIEVVRAYAPDDMALIDRAQMKQVLLNVLLNSIEAMDGHGRVTISTACASEHLEIAVQDTGRGIPAEQLSRVFDPFYTTKDTGTGLGLSVVHGIVQEHGGRVLIESQPGRGTTVHIQLPKP